MRTLLLGLPLFPCLAALTALHAQCNPVWPPSPGLPGTNGTVFASTWWDPDGPGPAAPRLVVGGNFTVAGTQLANRIAAWEPATDTWTAFGPGFGGSVYALASLPNGELVAAGEFVAAGSTPVAYIARWNGSTWSPLGSGMNFHVHALAVLPNGDLIAGGRFVTAGGVAAERIARWNGSAWSPLGSGLQFGLFTGVYALLALPTGELIAGGDFAFAGGVPANQIARWNGSSWAPLGSGSDGQVLALHRLPNGDVVAGGGGTFGGVATRVGRWNGTSWSGFGPGVFAPVASLTTLPNGALLAGMMGNLSGAVATWNGSSWSFDSGGPFATVHTLTSLPNGDPIAGGSFPACGSQPIRYLAKRSGGTWSALSPATFDDSVEALLALPNGDVIAGGRFVTAGGVPALRIARHDGTSWGALGGGMNGTVEALARLPNGDVLAGGSFTSAGGAPAAGLAVWNGTTWAQFGGGIGGTPGIGVPTVQAILVLPGGDVVIGGTFSAAGAVAATNVARWNGASWAPLGQGLGGGSPFTVIGVGALARMPNGDFVAGGAFPVVDGVFVGNAKVARWNGTSWTAMTGLPGSRAESLLVRANGDLIANATPFEVLHRWTGASWTPLPGSPSGSVWAMVDLPDGDLLAGGALPGSNLVRWDGATWTDVGAADAVVQALATAPDGDVLIGGQFNVIGGQVASRFARLGTSCPATAVASGGGCVGSGGTMALAATSLPWLGGAATALATGLPAGSIAIGVRGFVLGSAPLGLPNAGPGCLLYASPDLLDAYIPTGGVVGTTLAIPDSPALVGLVVHEQMIGIRFGVGGVVEAVSSNALSLTLGDF